MGVFGFFTYSSETKVESPTETRHVKFQSATVVIPESNGESSAVTSVQDARDATESTPFGSTETTATSPATQSAEGRQFSFRSFSFVRKTPLDHKPALSSFEEKSKRDRAAEASVRHAQKRHLSRSDKRAKKSALVVRSLIVGPPTSAEPKVTPAVAKPQLNKIKSQLMETKSANKLIAQLRELPATGDPSLARRNGPIHAVCLEHTDEEEDCLHFAKLAPPDSPSADVTTQVFGLPGVESAPVEKLADLFKEMRVIDLVKAPDLGLGQPGDGDGLLAGALPTAGTVIDGVKRITPELMALGYATGRTFTPDHSGEYGGSDVHLDVTHLLAGIYPPTDRMSVLTCEQPNITIV